MGSFVLSVEKSSTTNIMPEDMQLTLTAKSKESSCVNIVKDLIRIVILSGTIKEKAMAFTNSKNWFGKNINLQKYELRPIFCQYM